MRGKPPTRILVRIGHKPSSPMIHDDIRTLLEAPPTGDDAPSLDGASDESPAPKRVGVA